MNVVETAIPGVLIVEPDVFDDGRGSFMETFQAVRYAAIGVVAPFVQDNFSRSLQGVLRGLHFQSPKLQGKLVTVLSGRVLDVAVDIRVGSPTFGQHRWNDPALDIHWGCDAPKLSARDADGRTLAELEAWLPRYLPA
ncbi:MAG: dTDP-4-keto-6-deoxy-D-glucose epimerase [Alphaproteobacteria bacterium]|nr:MAG: dTDP-4-keto-6-deoxy-D-glucose epimerase [Alphaproteobacteria bacterium]